MRRDQWPEAWRIDKKAEIIALGIGEPGAELGSPLAGDDDVAMERELASAA